MAAPEAVGFGGLADEHAEAVGGLRRAVFCGGGLEGGGGVGVGHVVGESAVSVGGWRNVGGGAGEAAGGAVDDDVETAFQTACFDGGDAEAAGEGLGFFVGAVGDGEFCGVFGQQGLQHAAHRAARAEDEDAFAAEGDAEVARDVGDEAESVGVVGADEAV